MWVECNFDDDCEHLDSLGQSALDGPTETTARVLMIENFEAADPQLYWEATFLYAVPQYGRAETPWNLSSFQYWKGAKIS